MPIISFSDVIYIVNTEWRCKTRFYNIVSSTLNVILKGDENLSYETNVSIFESVHKYIQNTNRF